MRSIRTWTITMMLVSVFSDIFSITVTTHDKRHQVKMVTKNPAMVTIQPNPNKHPNIHHPFLNNTERHKRLLPYISFYDELSFNKPIGNTPQNEPIYKITIPKGTRYTQQLVENTYRIIPRPHQIKVNPSPFHQGNIVPGPFIPIIMQPKGTTDKMPNFSDIYDTMSQMKLAHEENERNRFLTDNSQRIVVVERRPKSFVRFPSQRQNYKGHQSTVVNMYTPTNIDISLQENINSHEPNQQNHYRVHESQHNEPFLHKNIAIDLPISSIPYTHGKNNNIKISHLKQFLNEKLINSGKLETKKPFRPSPEIFEIPVRQPGKTSMLYLQQVQSPIQKPVATIIEENFVAEKLIPYAKPDHFIPSKLMPQDFITIDKYQPEKYHYIQKQIQPQIIKLEPIQKFENVPATVQPQVIMKHYEDAPRPILYSPVPKYQNPTIQPALQNHIPTENTNTLSTILKKLQETNTLPHTLTPDNIDNSIKTLVKILSSLKEKPKFNKPIVVADQNFGDYSQEDEGQIETNDPHLSFSGSVQNFPDDTPDGGTPGKPGIDYPALSTIPQTSFNCKTQRYKGFFGDPDTNCQVWHYCDLNGGQASFLCPNGTIFSQIALTCDWWYNVKCSTTTQLYVLNERLYKYILPLSPKFPEDYSGPLVDKYLALKFQEMEEKMKTQKKGKEDENNEEEKDDADSLQSIENEKQLQILENEKQRTTTIESTEVK